MKSAKGSTRPLPQQTKPTASDSSNKSSSVCACSLVKLLTLCFAFPALAVGLAIAADLSPLPLLPLPSASLPIECNGAEDGGGGEQCPHRFFSQDYDSARRKFRNAVRRIVRLRGAGGGDCAAKVPPKEGDEGSFGVFGDEISLTPLLVAGVDYTMDVAVFRGKGPSAENVLVHLSGTHGVEGFAGSALQHSLLAGWNWTTPSSSGGGGVDNRPTVIFVHAVNPFGFAHGRRFNENNVDLNRNHLTTADEWRAATTRDPDATYFASLWAQIRPAIDSADSLRAPSLWDRYAMLLSAARFIITEGYMKCKVALASGQYHDKTAVYWGGDKLQPSLEILVRALRPYLEGSSAGDDGRKDSFCVSSDPAAAGIGVEGIASVTSSWGGQRCWSTPFPRARRVIVIDAHTGMGPKGQDVMVVSSAAEKTEAERVFGANGRIHATDGSSSSSGGEDADGSGGFELVMGMLSLKKEFWPAIAAAADVTGVGVGRKATKNSDADAKTQPVASFLEVTEEFGTVPGVIIARDTILENAVYQHAKAGISAAAGDGEGSSSQQHHEALAQALKDSPSHRAASQWLRDAFYPQDMVFKGAVVRYGGDAFFRAVQHLTERNV